MLTMRYLAKNIYMASRLCLAYLFIVLLTGSACTKSDSTISNGNGNANNNLKNFSVKVIDRTPTGAVIQWDSCINKLNSELPKYRVLLSGRTIKSNIVQLTDTLKGLSKDSVYNGKVVAYISTGDTVFAEFTLSTYQGIIYAKSSIRDPFQTRVYTLGKFNAYPDLNVVTQPTYWRTAWSYLNNVSPFDDLVHSNDTIFSIIDGQIVAANASNGGKIWQTSFNQNFLSNINYYQGKLYACTSLGLTAFNAANGNVLWSYASNNPSVIFKATPVFYDGLVFACTVNYSDGEIHGVNANSGTKVWSVKSFVELDNRPLIVDDKLIVPTTKSFHELTVYNAKTGSVVWSKILDNSYIGFDFDPVFSNGNIIVSVVGSIYALNMQTGATSWTGYNFGGKSSQAVCGGGKVYLTGNSNGTSGNDIFCFDAKSGKMLWNTVGRPSIQTNQHLLYAKDRIYCFGSFVNSYSSIIYTYNTENGNWDETMSVRNPVVRSTYEAIHSFVIERDKVFYYPGHHGSYK